MNPPANVVTPLARATSTRPLDRALVSAFLANVPDGEEIPAENLGRIFHHGFTTKANGHGFGLHCSANAAREMKGSLTVHSDGPRTGATFVLDLPASTSV